LADLLLYFFIMLAGLLSFLSPCVLPLVPPYLCYLGGVTFDELSGTQKKLPPHVHGRIILAAVFFVLGFTTIFVALGAGASAFGQLLLGYKLVLTRIAGVVILIFGLHFLGVFRIGFLYRDTRFQTSSTNVSIVGAFVMGLAFAFGWTPCIGPILSPVMSIAADSSTVSRGITMLMFYSLGLGIPFVLAAVLIQPFLNFIQKFQRHLGTMEKMSGILLIIVGLLFINATLDWSYSWISLNGFSTWLLENFEWMQSVEKLLVPDDVADKILTPVD
jgi:cytochrome c-type biogenesis protein